MATPDGLVVAKTSFYSAALRGMVRAGDIWDGTDPVVKGYPAAFGPLVVHASPAPKPERPNPRRPLTQRRATAAR